jgi:hypothetical protein
MGQLDATFGKILLRYLDATTEIRLQAPYISVHRSHWCKRASFSFDAGLTLHSLFGITILQVITCAFVIHQLKSDVET